MIRRFNIYILWEITKLFLVALIAFTTIFMLAVVVQTLLSQGLGPRAIFDMLPFVLPISLQYALPATLLFAVCSVYGRIAADNEVLAVMASGVKPMRIMAPTLIASFFISLFAVWLNDIAVPWGKPGINRVVMHSIEQVAYGYLSTQGWYSSEGFSIHVHGVGPDGRELISPTITTTPKGGGAPLSISAKSARLIMDPVKEVLRIELVDSEIDHDKILGVISGPSAYEVSLASATKKGISSGHPTEYLMRQISTEIRDEKLAIDQNQEILAARAAMALGVGHYDWLDDARTHEALGQVGVAEQRICRLGLEPWRRWASGFWCLCFVWVGVPLAIWMKSSDHWTSFGACFMPILLLYFPLFAIGLDHAKDGSWPPVCIWLGNVVLLAVGVWWMRKVHRG